MDGRAASAGGAEAFVPEPAEADGLPMPRRLLAAAAIWLALTMSLLDSSIANIALPTIARELGTSPAGSIWVVNAYQIALLMALLPVAAIAEIVGYRRTYCFGLALFVIASLGCVTSTSLTALAISRFVQGFGAASIMGINGALVRFIYPRRMLGRGVGYNALVVAIASAAGPSIAAAILAIASWRWLFAVNLPIGLCALAMAARALPARPGVKARLDLGSVLLNMAAFATGFLACSDLAHGVHTLRTGTEAAVALALFLLLIRRARGEERPLVPVDLIRIPILRLSYASSAFAFAAQTILLVSLPFYFQTRMGFGTAATGLLITPMPLGVAIAAPISGRVVERVPAGLLGGAGLVALCLGALAAALLPPGVPIAWLLAASGLAGLGFGFFQTPNNRTMLGLAPADRSGAAAGMLATSRLTGQTIGAIMVALLFRLVGPATNLTLLLAAALAAVGAAFSLRRLGAGEAGRSLPLAAAACEMPDLLVSAEARPAHRRWRDRPGR